MQQSVVKFYHFVVQTLLNMFRALLCPSSGARRTAVAASGFRMNVEVDVFSAVVGRPRLRTRPPPHSYGNQRVQRQLDGLLMMGIIMPESCWAVSVRQSNKILQLIVVSSWVFYLSDWRCTEPQTLNTLQMFEREVDGSMDKPFHGSLSVWCGLNVEHPEYEG